MSTRPTSTERHADATQDQGGPDTSELAERAEELLALALAAGADEAEVAASASRSVSLGFEKGEAKTAQVERARALGLRVFVDRRLGFVSTNQLHRGALHAAAEDAIALARSSPRDEANVLPAPRIADETSLTPAALRAALDPRLADFGIDAVVAHASDFVASVRDRDPRLSVDQAHVTGRIEAFLLRASNGLALEQTDASASGSVFGMAIAGSDVGGFDARGTMTRTLDALAQSLAQIGARFAETALGNLGAGAGESYRGPVLLSPEAFHAMLLGPLVAASSAIAVQRKRSRLAGAVGTAIAVPGLTVHDDPTDLALAGASAFDREGQPATRRALVSEGRLESYLYNGYAAAVDGVASTGNAMGGARSLPGLGTHALVVDGGDGGDEAALVRTLGRGLVVQRFSGSVDPASGDFSGVAKSARWVEHGALARPVREVLLAGNAFELLRGALVLASEPELVSGGARIPWVIVDGLTVTAG
ncbi:MAG: metallopeptidase TldD-related protein [Planctomycetota bacterium]